MRRHLIGMAAVLSCSCAFAAAPDCVLPDSFPTTPGYVPIYADRDKGGAFSQVDPAAFDEMKRIMDGFWRGSDALFQLTNAVAKTGDQSKAYCALSILKKWADDGHMLGEAKGTSAEMLQSIYETKWSLQGYATAYALLLKKAATADERSQIEAWLSQVAQRVVRHQIDRYSARNHNNHYYWAGATVMAVALAAEDKTLMQIARKTFETGIDEIRDDGSLPREAARKQQALHYHAFALTPLVLMAEMAHMAGEEWYAYRPDRLPLLASLVLRGTEDPAAAEKQFGSAQDRKLATVCSSDHAWLFFAEGRLANAEQVEKHAPKPGRCSYRYLGGDLGLMKERGFFGQQFEIGGRAR